MILSKFALDMRSFHARKCMTDCQVMHRSIMQMFHCTRQEGSVLYRFHTQKLAVYILSEKEPDLEDIPAGMRFVGKRDMGTWESHLESGQKFCFELLAAPTKKIAERNARNSRRRFLRSPQERMDWLARKAEQAGFSLLQVQENTSETIVGKHKKTAGGQFYYHAMSFQGILAIQDKEKFHTAWKTGIGPGRAYGQGMLLLARM